MKKLKQYQSVILSLFTIIITVIVFTFVYYPKLNESIAQYEANKLIERENKELKDKLTLLNQMDETGLRDNLQTLLSAVPGEKSLGTLISTLDIVASENNIILGEVNIGSPGSLSTQSAQTAASPESKNGIPTVAYETQITGDTSQIKSFLGLLQNVRRLLGIISVDLSFDENSSGVGKLELVGFYKNLPTNLGQVTTALSPLTQNELAILSKLNSLPEKKINFVIPEGVNTSSRTNPFANQ